MPLDTLTRESQTKKRIRIGQMLVSQGLLSPQQLQHALSEKRKHGGRIGAVLKRLGYLTEEAFAKALGKQMDVPYFDLADVTIPSEVLRKIPEWLCRKHLLIPLRIKKRNLAVAMADPLNYEAINDLLFHVSMAIKPAIATREQILAKIEENYGIDQKAVTKIVEASAQEFNSDTIKVVPVLSEQTDQKTLEQRSRMGPVVQLANMILIKAIKAGASDVHIEPTPDACRVRYRIDGILQEDMRLPSQVEKALTSRIKILASLDISERRLPQDGAVRAVLDGKEVDLRVSTLPTLYGEKIVIRLLDQSKAILSLPKIGLSKTVFDQVDAMIHQSYGLILVTGPTGSGKTTTLYAALNRIDSVGKNIVTIEDPVEYRVKTINQVPINAKAGLTFAAGLRSILRQDPDIVMVGEIRDRETAVIAIQAALTGHLVLSTLHTNDAASAVARLIDMGVEPFLIASSLLGVIAQRLVRKVCRHCKTDDSVDPDLLRDLVPNNRFEGGIVPRFFKGTGCSRCWKTGYNGRAGIYELLAVDSDIRKLVGTGASADEIRLAAGKKGFRPLRAEGFALAAEGITSIEEVLRVTQGEETAVGHR